MNFLSSRINMAASDDDHANQRTEQDQRSPSPDEKSVNTYYQNFSS